MVMLKVTLFVISCPYDDLKICVKGNWRDVSSYQPLDGWIQSSFNNGSVALRLTLLYQLPARHIQALFLP